MLDSRCIVLLASRCIIVVYSDFHNDRLFFLNKKNLKFEFRTGSVFVLSVSYK